MKLSHKFMPLSLALVATCFGSIYAEAPKLIRHFTFDQGLTELIYGNEPTEIIGNPTFASGISGQAIQLDGSSALIYDDYFDLHLDQFTLTAWVKTENISHVGSIAGKGSDIYWIFFNHGEIKSGFYDHKFQECFSGLYLQPNKWYFLAITYDGETLRAYINHHLDSIKKVQSAPRRMDAPFIIGAEGNNPSKSFFNGTIDEVRLYNGALSKTDIQKLYTSDKPKSLK